MTIGLDEGPILVIESSSQRASIAVVRGQRLIAQTDVAMRAGRDEPLMPAIADTLQRARLRVSELATVIFGAGPGSFTGLRIGAAIGKGLVTGTGARFGTVSSMALMVGGHDGVPDGRYLASVDALRGEQYSAVVAVGAGCVREVGHVMLIRAEELEERARELGAVTMGPGCAIDAWPVARGIVRAADVVRIVDVASWEPDYGRLPAAEVKRAAV